MELHHQAATVNLFLRDALAAYYEVGPYLRETQPPARDTAYLSGIASYTF
jgi:hypothetical protein